MDPTPIQSWKYNYGNTPYRLELFETHLKVQSNNSFDGPKTYKHPIAFFLRNSIPAPNAIIAELLPLIIQHYQPAEALQAEEEKHWQFWKHLQLDQLKPAFFNAATPINFQTHFIEFDGIWVKEGLIIKDKRYIRRTIRIDQFFFYGPDVGGFSIPQRRNMQAGIFKALAPNSSLKQEDAFPLFDYTKIPTKRWQHDYSSFKFTFIDLKENHVLIGGQENPRDAGATSYSIERIWFNSPLMHAKEFKSAHQAIKTILKKAILERS